MLRPCPKQIPETQKYYLSSGISLRLARRNYQQEIAELRSLISSVRSSRASSRRSIGLRREQDGGERLRMEPTGLSGEETLGLETITPSESDRKDWYEPMGGNRSIPEADGRHQRIAESASMKIAANG
jgi:hypothetical protein